MKVTVDAELCTGCELCINSAPEVLKMEGDKAVPITPEVSEANTGQAKEAIESCPVEAIKAE